MLDVAELASTKVVIRTGRAKQIRITADGTALKHWRDAVLERDGHKCVACGSVNELEADHIKPKSLYPDLKYEVSNGRALCWPCHSKTETYGSKVRSLASVEVDTI